MTISPENLIVSRDPIVPNDTVIKSGTEFPLIEINEAPEAGCPAIQALTATAISTWQGSGEQFVQVPCPHAKAGMGRTFMVCTNEAMDAKRNARDREGKLAVKCPLDEICGSVRTETGKKIPIFMDVHKA